MAMFSDPKKNIDQCGIQPGMNIADFGSGSGYYALEASKALMGTGHVYAIDVQKDLLARLKNLAIRQHVFNIEVVWGNIEKPEGTRLKSGSIDLVLVCNLLFQIEDKKTLVDEIKRILVPGGRVLVIDWSDSFGGIGPHKNNVITEDQALALFERAGFAKDRPVQAGSHHYGMIVKKL